jgi:DNA-binding beta-propeller fold protein YncE
MRNRNVMFVTVACLAVVASIPLAGLGSAIPAATGSSGYHVIKRIPIGGTEGWDYLTMDSAARILYVSRQNHVVAVNVDTGAVVGKVTGLGGTNGLLPVPELGRGFATNEDTSEVFIVDLKSLQKIGTVKTGKAPDSFAYEPVTKRVFIMNSAGASATAINAADGTVAGTVALNGQPEFVVADGKGKVYINITDKNEVAEVDAESLKMLQHWSLAPGEGPSGISMDRKNRRLFSACDNQKMIVMNADTGKVVAALPTGAGTDASLFDPDTMNAFASAGGSGTLTVIHEDSPDKYRVLEDVPTQSGARTMALDTKTHNVLLATARHGHGSTHLDVLPDTFVVLVVGK